MEFELSEKLKRLPPYLFAQIDAKKAQLKKRGIKFIDVSIGDPDIPAPAGVCKVLAEAALKKSNQKYALDQGKPEFRRAIKDWSLKRFGVRLDESKEILPLIGSKEGLVHFPLGFAGRGDYVIVPSPGYPGYQGAALLAGARVHRVPLLKMNAFLPDLEKIPISVRNKAKIIYLNYPNNPTTALAPLEFLKRTVKFCAKYGIILAYDNAYSEIYFDDKPLSILEVEGAREIAIEFHSLSKTFCMTGFRVGWAAGNSHLIKTLMKVKGNVDSGIFGAIQEAAVHALKKEARYVRSLRKTLKERRDFFTEKLKENGFTEIYAASTFYVWAGVPPRFESSLELVEYLLTKRNVVATPGMGFGKYGEGFIRFALTVDRRVLAKVFKRGLII